jgi:acyl dehydratase
MPLNRDFVGREYPSTDTYEVSRELIRRFAQAIGDTNPAYTDVDAAKALGHPDVIAPPTFLTVLGFRYAGDGPLADPALGLNYALVVHGEQKFVHHRPLTAGDDVVGVLHVDAVRAAGGHAMVTTRTELSVEGEPVCTAVSTLVIRGGE